MILKRDEKDNKIKAIYDSSNILESTYDTANLELIITFHKGTRYSYKNVSKSDYMRFETSESQGKVFNSHIKNHETIKLDSVDPSTVIAEAHQLFSQEKVVEFNNRKIKLCAGFNQIISIPNIDSPDKYQEQISNFISILEKLKIAVDNFIKDFKTN